MISICMLNYVIDSFVNFLILSLNSVWRKVFSHQREKKANVVPIKQPADLTLFSQSLEKFSKVLFITRCSHILQKTTSYLKINQKLNLVILVSTNYQPLIYEFISALIIIMKLVGYSSTFQKLSMNYDTKELFIQRNGI